MHKHKSSIGSEHSPPKSHTWVKILIGVVAVLGLALIGLGIWYWFAPDTAAQTETQKLAEQAEQQKLAEQAECQRNLNITLYGEKKILCPPGYTLGWNQLWGGGDKMCSMLDKTKTNCGWGSCNPSYYTIPGWGKWPNTEKGKDPRDKQEFTDSGSYFAGNYGGATLYMTQGVEYNDSHCPL